VVDPKGPKDPALTVLVDKYAHLAEPLENRVVAKVTREITLMSNQSGESTMGNLIADAHLASAAAPDKGGAVIAFNNPGSLRSPIIPAADSSVKYGDLFKTQPFQNDLISMNLTGKQLKNLLEQQFGDDRPRIMSVSNGFSYSWDSTRPKGDKVIASSMKLNGMPVSPELQYRVVANSFVAGGSEGMTIFRDGTERQVGVLDWRRWWHSLLRIRRIRRRRWAALRRSINSAACPALGPCRKKNSRGLNSAKLLHSCNIPGRFIGLFFWKIPQTKFQNCAGSHCNE